MSKKKIKILIAVVIVLIPVAFVLFQITALFASRSENQRAENKRIIPVIADSQKAFKPSLVQNGKTKVTVLLENYRDPAVEGIEADHGISLCVERKGKTFIFDLGESDVTLANAVALGIDITKVDSVFVSHGHNDHGSALPTFLEKNNSASVYLSAYARENHYRLLFGFYKLNTGLAKNAPDLFTRHKDRFVFIEQDTMIEDNIFVLTGIKGEYKKPSANNGVLREDAYGNIIEDDFVHEVAYVIKDEDGLIIYSGCNYNGLLNTLDTAAMRFPDIPIKALLGGFHLMNPVTVKMTETQEEVRKMATELQRKYPTTQIFTGHCTGVEGYGILKSVLGDRIEYFTSGSEFLIL